VQNVQQTNNGAGLGHVLEVQQGASVSSHVGGWPHVVSDEVEAFNAKNKSEAAQAILAVLNAGHRKGATVPRCEGPKHELRHFPVYGPKVFAAIGRLPDTVTDRSILINMQRRTKAQSRPVFDGACQGGGQTYP
jgi:hypothetical protein